MPRPVVIRELKGQGVSGSNATRQYIFVGFANAVAVDARIKAFGTGTYEIPAYWGGLPINLPCDIREEGGGTWTVTAQYGPRAGDEAGPDSGGGVPANQETAPDHGDGSADPVPPEITISTGGGTRHIKQSIETIDKRGPNGGNCPSFKQAIGVNPTTTEVAGVDIVAADFKWSLDLTLPVLTAAFINKCWAATGCTNKTAFFGYQAGEVLLVNVNLTSNGASGGWKAHFDFANKRNRAEVYLYGSAEDPPNSLYLENVPGWAYVWCTYGQKTVTVDSKERTVNVPTAAYMERVYEEYEFNNLDLKTRRKKPA